MNNLVIAGRIGTDAEIRFMNDGKPVAVWKVAVNEGRADGDDQSKTTWVRCSMWGSRAEKIAPFLKKGTPVAVTGRAAVNAWTDRQSGEAKGELQLRVADVTLLGPKRDAMQADSPQEPASAATKAAPVPDDFDVPF